MSQPNRLVDIFVYAPLGAGLYLVEAAPSVIETLVARGRAEVDQKRETLGRHVTTARSTGQVALAFGLPKVRDRIGTVVFSRAPEPEPTPAAPTINFSVRATRRAGCERRPRGSVARSSRSPVTTRCPLRRSSSASSVSRPRTRRRARLRNCAPQPAHDPRQDRSTGRAPRLMEPARAATAADVERLVELAHALRAELRDDARRAAVGDPRRARPSPTRRRSRRCSSRADATVVVGTIDAVVVGYGTMEIEVLADGSRLARDRRPLRRTRSAGGRGGGDHCHRARRRLRDSAGCAGIDAVALPGHRQAKNFFERNGFTARALVMHKPLCMNAPGPRARIVAAGGIVVHDGALLCSCGAGSRRDSGSGRCPAVGSSSASRCAKPWRVRCGKRPASRSRSGSSRAGSSGPATRVTTSSSSTSTPRPSARPRSRPGDDAAEARWVPVAEVSGYDLVDGLLDVPPADR